MADYSPLFLPGAEITTTASAAVTAGFPVEVSGSDTVQNAGSSSRKVIGVAGADAATNGLVMIFGRGTVHISTAAGAITAGAQLIVGSIAGTVSALVDASGATAGDINNARSVIGIAMTTASDTANVTWMEL
jgi:Uncharacterized conserved protein (DUF2190)